MGFRARRSEKLDLSDRPEFEGLNVFMVGATVGEAIGLRAYDDIRMVNGIVNPEDAQLADEMYLVILAHVTDWNLEDKNGNVVPLTLEAIQEVDADIMMAIWNAWVMRVTGMVARPLENESTSTEKSAEESLPMETL